MLSSNPFRSSTSETSPQEGNGFQDYEDISAINVTIQRRNARVSMERFDPEESLLDDSTFVSGDSFNFESMDQSNQDSDRPGRREQGDIGNAGRDRDPDALFWEELLMLPNLGEVVFQDTNNLRFLLLQKLLEKIYPDETGFWVETSNWESNCVEVCTWFGFSSNGDIVKGTSASTEEQIEFWLNVISAAKSLKEFGGFSQRMLKFLQRLELYLKETKNAAICDGGLGHKAESVCEVKQVIQNISEICSDNFKHVSSIAEDVFAQNTTIDPLLAGFDNQVEALTKAYDLMNSFTTLYKLEITGTRNQEREVTTRNANSNNVADLLRNTQLCMDKFLEVVQLDKIILPV